MNTPSSPIVIDALAELKQLRESIALVKQEKEVALSDRDAILSEVEYLGGKTEALNAEVHGVARILIEIIGTGKETLAETLALIAEAKNLLGSFKETLQSVYEQIGTATSELSAINLHKDQTLADIAREKIAMDTEKQDLNIYRTRLQKIITDNNLPIKLL